MNLSSYNTRLLSIVFLLLSVFLSLSQTTMAQGLEALIGYGVKAAITAELADKVGTDLIQQAHAAAASLIAQAQHSGNVLIARAGNELDVLAQNAARTAGEQARLTVRQMTADLQPVMNALFDLTTNANKLLDRAYDLKDATFLDLRAVMRTIPLTGENFYVQRLDGIAQLPRSGGEFRLAIWGTGLGISTDTIRSSVTLYIKGRAVSDQGLADTPHTRRFAVSHDILAPFFIADKLALLDAAYEITQETRHGFIFKTWKSAKYHVPFKLALLPPRLGTLIVRTTLPQYSWQKVRTESKSLTTGDHNCPRCKDPPKVPYTLEIKVPGSTSGTPKPTDQKLANARHWCITNVVEKRVSLFQGTSIPIKVDQSTCGWTQATGLSLVENDTRVVASWLAWSSPVTWKLSADILEYKLTGKSEVKESKYDLYYGEVAEIRVSAGDGVVAIGRGMTFSHRNFEFPIGSNDDAGFVTLQRQVVGSEFMTYLYRVNRPAGVD